MQKRHHAAHPATQVAPNKNVNKKPESYTPPAPAFGRPSSTPVLPGQVSHAPSNPDHTTHGQPKGTGEIPAANNAYDGVDNHNDSPAGTAGLHVS